MCETYTHTFMYNLIYRDTVSVIVEGKCWSFKWVQSSRCAVGFIKRITAVQLDILFTLSLMMVRWCVFHCGSILKLALLIQQLSQVHPIARGIALVGRWRTNVCVSIRQDMNKRHGKYTFPLWLPLDVPNLRTKKKGYNHVALKNRWISENECTPEDYQFIFNNSMARTILLVAW